ncbi:DegT/DnrJ/EryC1/StrS family aminotransferase [Longirhabdus pacifica]|uniref:DegT/DnrJ/EryC1/StrS family aminotransferase n=1 Tax=Longirhabdus pacifica TaxID=2305227 RepID=UPI0010090C65|nr:DegT/DnrJ/EryC1/StrS family aminotransferase [Longirhabdus pacifica]
MGVLFSSAQSEFEIIKDKWMQEVEKIGMKGQFVGGRPVDQFEKNFAAYVGTKHAVGVGNGTDALFLSLKSLGVGPGDEVITVANTFIATVEAIHHTGATPVLVDCTADTYLMDVEQVKQKVTAKTKAIIPVHLYGQCMDIRELTQWARDRGIYIIEDTAQAIGADVEGMKAGSMGDLACFSFYPGKNLGALGDGGCIVTNNTELATQLKKLRNHGGQHLYDHQCPGFNSRLDVIHAIALNEKLHYMNEWTKHRQRCAELYIEQLKGSSAVSLPFYEQIERHVFHVFVIRVQMENRDALKKHLLKKGIITTTHYPKPIHLTGAFSYLPYEEGTFPIAEQCSQEMLSLPMHIALSEADITAVCEAIKEQLHEE